MKRATGWLAKRGLVLFTSAWVACLLFTGTAGAAFAAAPDGLVDSTHPTIPDSIQQRAKACTSCHGEHGEGDTGEGPRLAGKPAAYLLLQMRYFQSGQRKNVAMEYVLRQLDVDYMKNLADYFAGQQVAYPEPSPTKASAAALQRGEQLALHGDPAIGVPACNSCHGSRLTGVEPLIPGLIGLSTHYVQAELVAWRNQTRAAKEPFCMGVVANRMRVEDVAAVSDWLATQRAGADMRAEPAAEQTAPMPGWCVMSGSGNHP